MIKSSSFDQKAANWDTAEKLSRSEAVANFVLDRFELQDHLSVIDLGCGTGQLSFLLTRTAKSLIGVDNSKGMLEVFDQKIQQLGIKNAKSKLVDMEQGLKGLPKADLIVSEMTMHHIPNIDNFLASCFALTEPEGALIIADLDAEDGSFHDDNAGVYHQGFSAEYMREAFEKAGYTDVDTEKVFVIKKETDQGRKVYNILATIGFR
ncbi:MAG: hypothetical protein RIS47_642, partial [Bacteroidota bacterium]